MAGEYPATTLADTEWQGEVMALVQDMAAGLGAETYVRQTRALQRRPDQQKTLRKVKTPALILAGEADTLVPLRRQEFLAGLMPFGRLQVIDRRRPPAATGTARSRQRALLDFLAGPMLLR